ncbi:MAG TPA: ATP-binding cassette domain-containing protein [Gemmatimonadaceae bacterium]|nr:ATP-binding cassette domain-containing protein [Gemmatimonadaceae bacterium]
MARLESLVRLEHVTKSFGGRPAVDALSFDVRRGEVFALLGPNGAGKTTTVRMLVGVIRPDEGRIVVSLDGQPRVSLPPALTGYLPEDRGLYREIPVLRTLIYFGRLRGLEKHEARRRALEWLERLNLLDRKDERVAALSKGNQQRVQFITAVIHRPQLALLDEPFTGLDPLSQELFLGIVRDLREAGTTIILSAHQMDLVERAADRVLLMNQGREVLSGSIDELHGRLDGRPRVRLALDGTASLEALREDPDVAEVTADDADPTAIHIRLRDGATVARFLARAVTLVPLRSLSTERPRLHEVFVHVVREDDARRAGSPS